MEARSIMKKSLAASIAAVAAAAVFAGGALAQPAYPHGPRGHGDVAMAIAALKGQLNLNSSQQMMWDNAVTASKAARDSGRANLGRVHDALAKELAKAEPDLAAVSAVTDDVQTKNTALRHQARDTWLALYATFSPDQKAIVRDALKSRMAAGAERWQQKRLQQTPQS
jgi:Spy/CpxP family protein refolding chaperone